MVRQTTAPLPEPPAGLSDKSAELWRRVVETGRVRSPGRLALLEQALVALDTADAAAALVRAEGLVTRTTTSGAAHVHPAVKVEREHRQLFARLWMGMGLEWDGSLDGRAL